MQSNALSMRSSFFGLGPAAFRMATRMSMSDKPVNASKSKTACAAVLKRQVVLKVSMGNHPKVSRLLSR